MTYETNSATSDVGLAPLGLRIIRAMQPSASRGGRAECVAIGGARLTSALAPGRSAWLALARAGEDQ